MEGTCHLVQNGHMPEANDLSFDRKSYDLRTGIDEDRIWREFGAPKISGLADNIVQICQYGFTEMVNNVIDHSGSYQLTVGFSVDADALHFIVQDFGVGIFRKLRDALGLGNEHEAALELRKGRITTDPVNHTGEGIFFTARMFDVFVLESHGTAFVLKDGSADWMLEQAETPDPGTFVRMQIAKASSRTTRQIFDRFISSDGNFQFDTTRIGLRLMGLETGNLVSRSQAKRVVSRLEQFKAAVLDFDGVDDIGPAFADEIFRVFANAHPEVHIIPINANERVNQMIVRSLARNADSGQRE